MHMLLDAHSSPQKETSDLTESGARGEPKAVQRAVA